MSLCDLKCLLCKLEMLSAVRITLYRVGEDIILPYEMNENGFEAGRRGRRPLQGALNKMNVNGDFPVYS